MSDFFDKYRDIELWHDEHRRCPGCGAPSGTGMLCAKHKELWDATQENEAVEQDVTYLALVNRIRKMNTCAGCDGEAEDDYLCQSCRV